MSKNFKKQLKWDKFSQEKASELILNTFYKQFDNYNNTVNSKSVQYYFHTMVAIIMKDYHNYFPGYETEIDYRFKSPKSIIDKILDYMSREDTSKLEFDIKTKEFNYSINEIQDAFAMRIIINDRPSTFHSSDEKIDRLAQEKVENQKFLAELQEFQNNLIEDNLSIKPKYKYVITKKEYYSRCKKIIEHIILTIPEECKDLIAKYEKMKANIDETLVILDNSLEECELIDENDFPSDEIDFVKLFNDFSSRIYDKIDLEVLTRQMNSMFKDSESLKKLGITFNGFKEKRSDKGYVSNFIYLQTPLGPIECQLQSKHQFKEGNFGYAAHGEMDNKQIERYKIPNIEDDKKIQHFREAVSFISPSVYRAKLDNVEKNKVLIEGYSDYKNYRNIVGQVQEGSPQEKALLTYFSKMYNIRDKIFDPSEEFFEFSKYDIENYLKSSELKEIIEKLVNKEDEELQH